MHAIRSTRFCREKLSLCSTIAVLLTGYALEGNKAVSDDEIKCPWCASTISFVQAVYVCVVFVSVPCIVCVNEQVSIYSRRRNTLQYCILISIERTCQMSLSFQRRHLARNSFLYHTGLVQVFHMHRPGMKVVNERRPSTNASRVAGQISCY